LNAYAKAREMQAHALVDKAPVIARDERSDFYRDEYGRKKVAVFATQSFRKRFELYPLHPFRR
jgi:hypothetical protein